MSIDRPTEHDQQGHVVEPSKTISRREFLGAITGAFGASILAGGVPFLEPTISSAYTDHHGEGHDDNDHGSDSETHHGEHVEAIQHEVETEVERLEKELPEWLDYSTAMSVMGGFAYHVLYQSAYNGVELSAKSALWLGGLAQARITLLKLFGGAEGAELAHEDQHEIQHGLLPVPILVGLSDFTTTSFEVDSTEVFDTSLGVLEEGMDYSKVKRPELSADTADWKKHLEAVKADLSEQVAQVAALTSVLAPLGTTYAGSAISNSLKERVMRMLYEKAFAEKLIADKNAGREIEHFDELHEHASEVADKQMNGSFGYSKLQFALSANTQGSWGIGDPPELYFGMNYAAHPSVLLKAHSVGLVNSELYTLALTGLWCQSAGVPFKLVGTLSNQLKTVKELIRTFASEELSDVSINDGDKQAAKVIKALESEGEAELADQLRAILPAMRKAKFKLTFTDYLEEKGLILSQLLNVAGSVPPLQIYGQVPESSFRTVDDFTASDIFERMTTAFTEGDTATLGKEIIALDIAFKRDNANELAILFDEFIRDTDNTHEELVDERSEHIDEELETDEEAQRRANDIITAGTILKRFSRHNEETRQSRVDQVLEMFISDKDADFGEFDSREAAILAKLKEADDKTVKKAISLLTRINGKEDAVPGLEPPEGGLPGDDVSDVMAHTHTEHHASLISHSAREVLFALLTQIPSVPSISRMASLTLPKAVGVEAGEKPSADQLKQIILAMIPIEAGMSALADNVAAYLFAEKVLHDFFKSRYGADLFEHRPDIKEKISIVALKIAEQAGSLTQVGNGPNFSQERTEIVKDDTNEQGISINRVKVTMGETLPQKNVFSSSANVTLVSIGVAYLSSLVDDLESNFAQAA